jgi:hypothetical protein
MAKSLPKMKKIYLLLDIIIITDEIVRASTQFPSPIEPLPFFNKDIAKILRRNWN